jgi:hypothetical protein
MDEGKIAAARLTPDTWRLAFLSVFIRVHLQSNVEF